MPVGTVHSLYCYPVKSLRGARYERIAIDQRGVAFDRLFALTNSDGKFGSHKTTRRFRKMPGLFDLHAAVVDDDDIHITFPDGTVLSANHRQIHQRLSEVAGESVELRSESEIPHYDDGAIHVLTTASIRWLERQLPQSVIDPRRFRPNLVVACPGDTPVENGWIGQTLQIGPCQLEVTHQTERCVMTTLAQDELAHDTAVLRTLNKLSDLNFGVYARVVAGGSIATGDAVQILSQIRAVRDRTDLQR